MRLVLVSLVYIDNHSNHHYHPTLFGYSRRKDDEHLCISSCFRKIRECLKPTLCHSYTLCQW